MDAFLQSYIPVAKGGFHLEREKPYSNMQNKIDFQSFIRKKCELIDENSMLTGFDRCDARH